MPQAVVLILTKLDSAVTPHLCWNWFDAPDFGMDDVFKIFMGVEKAEVIPSRGVGLISEAVSYQTEKGRYFVKGNTKTMARRMFEGERAGIKAILATGMVRCPNPIDILDYPDGPGSMYIMEYLDLQDLDQHASTLGEQMARLHLRNGRLIAREGKEASRIGFHKMDESGEEVERSVQRFGFHTTTCCGYLPLDNTWTDDWVTFYVQQRLKPNLDRIQQEYGDRELMELWPQLLREIPRFFRRLDRITPALLHGDMHARNVGETPKGPVIYDPACFYGHHEFELAVTKHFPGFNPNFFPSYHRLIPQAPGFDDREKLYMLSCYLNHWNHFGPKYRDKVKAISRELGHVGKA